jgi:hypothetical protein
MRIGQYPTIKKAAQKLGGFQAQVCSRPATTAERSSRRSVFRFRSPSVCRTVVPRVGCCSGRSVCDSANERKRTAGNQRGVFACDAAGFALKHPISVRTDSVRTGCYYILWPSATGAQDVEQQWAITPLARPQQGRPAWRRDRFAPSLPVQAEPMWPAFVQA